MRQSHWWSESPPDCGFGVECLHLTQAEPFAKMLPFHIQSTFDLLSSFISLFCRRFRIRVNSPNTSCEIPNPQKQSRSAAAAACKGCLRLFGGKKKRHFILRNFYCFGLRLFCTFFIHCWMKHFTSSLCAWPQSEVLLFLGFLFYFIICSCLFHSLFLYRNYTSTFLTWLWIKGMIESMLFVTELLAPLV